MAEFAITTRVKVSDLPLLADIGINPDEIGRRQPLVISVELRLAAASIDAIDQTIDYRRIARAAENLAEQHIPLIETFAQRLGAKCLEWPGVVEADIWIDKPFAITRGMAGVQVSMRAA
ncbi:MAG: dihydroneopterin aldolase [Sphingobium sp.]